MGLEQEVMLVYGSNNLKDYNIKVKEFIQDISVSATSGRTDLTTFAFQNESRENKLKDRLRAKALSLGANAVTGVKSTGELNSSLSGNGVIVEGEGYDKYVKRIRENPKKPINKFKSPLSIVLILLLVIFAIPVIKIIFGSIF